MCFCKTFLMIDEVECDDPLDLKKWIESLEDDFEPMLGVPDEGQEDSYITILNHERTDPRVVKGPRLETKNKLGGIVPSSTI